MKKRIKILFLSLLLSMSFLFVGSFVLAQSGDLVGLDVVDQNIELGATDPRIMAARIIQIFLGFLGIIAVSLIIYGGWIYMTSEGNEEKIEKAKNILKSAIIGLIIILSAFGIASFLLRSFMGATTPGHGVSGGLSPSFPPYDWGGGSGFVIRSTNPRDGDVNVVRNIQFRAFLNHSLGSIDSDILNNNVKVQKIAIINPETGEIEEGIYPFESVSGTVNMEVRGSILSFSAASTCQVEGQIIEHCLDEWSRYIVTINEYGELESQGGLRLHGGSSRTFELTTNDQVDGGPPITGIVPAQICVDDGSLKPGSNTLGGWARDDHGLSYVSFYQKRSGEDFGNPEYFSDAQGAKFFRNYYTINTGDMSTGDEYIFRFEAQDSVGLIGNSDYETIIRPAHCCNGIQDGDETGVDCGGSCLSCYGGPCNISEPNVCGVDESNCSDNLCSTFFCDCKGEEGCICEKKPIINWVSPSGGFCEDNLNQPCNTDSDCANGKCDQGTPNAKEGSIVSIGGRNFGDSPGKVYFGGEEAVLANTVNSNCDTSWTDRQIIAIAPLVEGDVSITVEGANGFSDSTDDSYGASIPDFKTTGFDRSGLCKLDPDQGEQNDRITYHGLGLTGSSPFFGSKANFIAGLNLQSTSNMEMSALVPNIRDGRTSSFAKTKINNIDVESNYLDFIKLKTVSGPQIFSFDPVEGRDSQYVTIRGRGFGRTQGSSQVFFGNNEADYSFPLVCADSLWSDRQVIVKVPEGVSDENYLIKMKLAGGVEIDSGSLSPANFTIDSGLDLSPGVCKIDPRVGTFGTEVGLWGEYFGSTQGSVRFSNNITQNTISVWEEDSASPDPKPYKIETSVPQEAQSGPVKVISSDSSESNSVDFQVGTCLESDDPSGVCGTGSICCPAGTFAEGECKSNIDECYFIPKNSVYEFEFSTGGSVAPPAFGSCSGYGFSQCSSSFLCPNSPGRCSPYTGGTPLEVGDCDCEGVGACTATDCSPNQTLQKCVLDGSSCSLNKTIDGLQSYCASYEGNNYYHAKTTTNCPNDWRMISASGAQPVVCVNLNQSCEVCDSGFICIDDSGSGVCAVDREICPSGATCDVLSEKCIKDEDSRCDCCCEIGEDARDCCYPLTCEGSCGAGTADVNGTTIDLGACSGCANAGATQADHDLACNCVGHSGKYCNTLDSDFPAGVCKDCAQLSPDECLNHPSTCCIDALMGGICRGGQGDPNNNNYCEDYAGPGINYVLPPEDGQDICRNTQISAEFDDLMDVRTFGNNIIVLGDYETGACPGDTQYLTINTQEHKQQNFIVRFFSKISNSFRKALAFILSPINSDIAYAVSPDPDHNYCVIRGSVSGQHDAVAATTTLIFEPSELLDAGRDYYVIIKGDPDFLSGAGVISQRGIGMIGLETATFNGIDFSNAKIWKFSTLPDLGEFDNGVCAVDKVEIYPQSYLFNTRDNDLNENDIDPNDKTFDTARDKDKVFTAIALSYDSQILVPTSGYSWQWNWDILNRQIVDFIPVSDFSDKRLVGVKTELLDASTEIHAKINFEPANVFTTNDMTATADVYVFLCENPWPTPTSAGWSPWKDEAQSCIGSDCPLTYYELYYCRDAGEYGTADDLPALADGSITRGSSDDILKESYLFRAELPALTAPTGAPFLTGEVKSEGKAVKLEWDSDSGVEKYKIYYGRNSGVYTNSAEVLPSPPQRIVQEITNLENGVNYYFAVTAISAEGAESAYSNEVILKPWDDEGPTAPDIEKLEEEISEDGSVQLRVVWQNNAGNDAKTFELSYKFGVDSADCDENVGFAVSVPISLPSPAFIDLPTQDNMKVCVGLVARDEYGNRSDWDIKHYTAP